jgi:NitT/TauT family transport system permease protein
MNTNAVASTAVVSEGRSAGSAPRAVQPRRLVIPSIAISTLAVLALVVLWVVVSTSGWLPQGYLPTPREIGEDLRTLFTEGYKNVSIWHHMGISLYRTLAGFLIGIAIGIPLGLVTGYSRIGGAIVSPIMAFVRPIPPIAFIPMVVLYFGLGELGKVVLIIWTAFNYVLVNAHAGAAGVPIAYQRAAQANGLTRAQTFFRVVFPAAIPQIFTGLKVAMALSWAVVVAAELVGAQAGLGYMISDAALTFRISTVFIGIALIGAIGLLLNVILNLLEARIVHWRGR